MKRITSLFIILLLSAASFSQSQNPEQIGAQLANSILESMASDNLDQVNSNSNRKSVNNTREKKQNTRANNLTLGLASERSSTKEWTVDLGVNARYHGLTQLFYIEEKGLVYVISYDKDLKQGVRQIVDPETKEILKKSNFEVDPGELFGLGAISPNGKYSVQDRWKSKNMVVFDLENEQEIAVVKKDQGAKYTGAAFKGVAFLSNTEYITVEGDASQPTNLSKLKTSFEIVRRSLPDNNELERWTIPNQDIERWKVQGLNQYQTGIYNIAYSPISSWGVPVLAIQNVRNLLVYDYSSKKLLLKLETNRTNGLIRSLSFSMKDYLIFGGDVYELASGDLFSSLNGKRDPFGASKSVLAESSLNECQIVIAGTDRKPKDRTLGLKGFFLPKVIQEEIAYKNWLKRCAAKKDSLAVLAGNVESHYSMNSPENDWIYIGTDGVNGLANGIGSAIRKDGMRFIVNGLFIDGNFVAGKMKNVYEVSMEGEFKDMQLNGFGRHVTENKAILEGTFVNGKLEGQGETIDPSGLRYVGAFKNGTFEGKGKVTRPDGETYDGEFLAGKPHGNGIYINGGQVERVEYYNGNRIDQAYLLRKENERAERQRQMEKLEEQKRAEYLAAQQKKKSSNGLFGALVMGTGFGLAGSSVGMDAMQAVEFGGAMFQDVQSGGTSNLNNFKSDMMSDFQAKRAQYEQEDTAYTQKAQEKNCNLSDIYEGPDGGQGGAYCAQATLMKCHGKMDRVAQLCRLFKQVTNETCPVCN